MVYTNLELVENFLNRSLTDKESNLLSTIVFAIERQIDKKLHTTFKNTVALYGAIRYFDGGKRHLEIDPCQNVTNISVIDADLSLTSTLDSSTYVLEPLNDSIKRMVSLRYGRFPRGYKNIKITADFTEYGAEEGGVPSDIQTIATRVAGSMLANPNSALGIKSESIEGHQITFGDTSGNPFEDDPVVKNLMSSRQIPLVDDEPLNALNEDAEDTLGIY